MNGVEKGKERRKSRGEGKLGYEQGTRSHKAKYRRWHRQVKQMGRLRDIEFNAASHSVREWTAWGRSDSAGAGRL